MDSVFIYWDNSNIFIGVQYVAMEREGQGARAHVDIHFGRAALCRACRLEQASNGYAIPIVLAPPMPTSSASGAKWRRSASKAPNTRDPRLVCASRPQLRRWQT